jgi:hypothetical protein
VKSYTLIQFNNIWRKSNHIEDQRLQKDDIVKEASTNEASKQTRDPKNQLDTRIYDDKSQKVL